MNLGGQENWKLWTALFQSLNIRVSWRNLDSPVTRGNKKSWELRNSWSPHTGQHHQRWDQLVLVTQIPPHICSIFLATGESSGLVTPEATCFARSVRWYFLCWAWGWEGWSGPVGEAGRGQGRGAGASEESFSEDSSLLRKRWSHTAVITTFSRQRMEDCLGCLVSSVIAWATWLSLKKIKIIKLYLIFSTSREKPNGCYCYLKWHCFQVSF